MFSFFPLLEVGCKDAGGRWPRLHALSRSSDRGCEASKAGFLQAWPGPRSLMQPALSKLILRLKYDPAGNWENIDIGE
jgi:hypothetical protein